MITVPEAQAQPLARALVREGLAACVQATPVCSVYRWEDKVEESAEILLIAKTVDERYPDLEARVRELHPYAVPEITAVQLDRLLPEYSDWLLESTRL